MQRIDLWAQQGKARAGQTERVALTLCTGAGASDSDPTDWSPPGSSVHGMSQARGQEWVAIAFSRGSSQPRNRTQGISQKLKKNGITIRSSNPTPGLYPKNLNQDFKMISVLPVHYNTIHNAQDVETTQMSIDG